MFERLLSLQVPIDEQTNEPTPTGLPLTEEAKRLWIEFHDAHADEQAELHGDLSAAWAKLTGYAARLSLICELASWASGDESSPPAEVGARALASGIALARWFSAETKRVYAVLQENAEQQAMRELCDYIRQQGGELTARDLTRGPRRYRGDVELAEAELRRLVDHELGTWSTEGSGLRGGRPTRRFRLSSMVPGDETPFALGENRGFVAVASKSAEGNGRSDGS